MFKKLNVIIGGIIGIIVLILIFSVFVKEDTINNFKRKQIEFIDGNYQISILGNNTKTWKITNSKVTSDSVKGYYYFWADCGKSKCYVQIPIMFTVIEELK